jgi:hypothetical protein
MKILKKISISLIIALAVLACVKSDCFFFSGDSFYVIENTTMEENSDNTITADNDDLYEVDVTLTQSDYSFNMNNLSGEKLTIVDSFFPKKLSFCIWQPPKVS